MLMTLKYHDELAMVRKDAYRKAREDGLAEARGRAVPDRTYEDNEILDAATGLMAFGRNDELACVLEDPDFRHEILSQYSDYLQELAKVKEHGRSPSEVFAEEYSEALSSWILSRYDGGTC